MVAHRLPTGSREIANNLYWVRVEIERNLVRVRGYLEQYLEGGSDDDRRPLLDAVDALSQVRGTARMVQCHGAATLTDEMLQLLQRLIAGNIDSTDAAYDALSSASLQLSDYIELLALGEPDRIIVLQPAINELRLARGKPLLTEAGLFVAQLQLRGVAPEPPTAARGEAQVLARKELNAFQSLFLQWFRGQDVAAALHGMNDIGERLANAVVSVPLRRLWWGMTLLTESLGDDYDDVLDAKRLLGRVGMQLRLLADRGEPAAAVAVGDSADLLLYHLVRAPQPSSRSRALIAAQELQQILPDSVVLAQVRRRLRRPNTSVLEHVHLEIRRDLQQVKDAIDLVVRTRGRAGADLGMQCQRLQRLADTLGVLGLQGPQQVLTNQARIVSGLDAASPAWIDTATALLRVEHSLEEALFRAQGRYAQSDARDYSEIEAEVPHARDLREAMAAMLRESLLDLAQVKLAVGACIDGSASGVAGDVTRLLTQVAAGLKIIERERASTLVREVAQHAADTGLAAIGSDAGMADRLADAITCVELYLEALRDGLPRPDHLLDRLQQYVSRLQPGSIPESAAAADAVAAVASADIPSASAAPTAVTADPIDPEIRRIFIEEATEVLTSLQHELHKLSRTPEDGKLLTSIRRAFHTLRGSAGVVGAVPVQRIAHAFEDYLNAVGMAGVHLSTAALDLMHEAVSKLGDGIGAAGSTADDISGLGEDVVVDCLQRLRALPPMLPSPQPLAGTAGASATDRNSFALHALDTLQTVEAELLDWHTQVQVTDSEHPVGEAIGSRLDGLAIAARAQGCTPMAEVCAALAERLRAVSDAPSPVLVAALEDVIEGLYQQLDAFREAEPVGEAAPLLDQIAGLPVASPRKSTAASASGDVPASDRQAPIDSPVIESSTDATPSAETPAAAPASVADPELREIFLEEAQELLLDYRQALQQAGQSPGEQAPLSVLRRILHTLKGSARMAGLEAVGSVSQHYEHNAIAAEDEPAQAAVQLPALQQAEHELRDLLTQAGAAFDGDPAPIASASEAPDASAAKAASSSNDDAAAAESGQPASKPLHDEWQAAPSVAATGVDAELTAVFSAEAGELLELLDSAFDAWRGGDAGDAVQDMRRALHTLKGGARVSGLVRMGDVAHELETRIEQVLANDGPLDEATLSPLRQNIEQLHLMHDALQRGDDGSLQAASTPLPTLQVAGDSQWNADLFWSPEDEREEGAALRREYARVPVDALNGMLNQSGEISIFRARLEQHNNGLRAQLTEMTQTIARIRGQLRMMDSETEAQIAARGLSADAERRDPDRYEHDFDPLEMDRYSRMQELSRALAEAVNDLSSLYGLLDQGVNETDTLLQQQGRIGTQVRQGLMSTLMVPFSRQQSRLERVVRQSALDTGKRVDLYFDGVSTELDRNVLERITAPLSHLLRNAVVHGIESPERRGAAGKPASGRIDVRLRREAEQLLIELSDDGNGLDFAAIRAKAIEQGRMHEGAELSEDDLARFIFESGFTTATELTQDAGRGIGLDVVASSVRQLGGTLELRSSAGQGMRFLVRLPLTLAVSQALLVVVGGEHYAVPLLAIIGIARIPVSELTTRLAADATPLNYAGQEYPVHYLGEFLDLSLPAEIESRSLVTLLVHAGETLTGEERRVALVVDELLGNRELISKAIGPQLSAVPGIAGASILADGRVVLILDVPALVTERSRRAHLASSAPPPAPARETVMVVDDSITMRRVAERLLDRAGYRVVTARDGLDAIALLQTELPAVVLLDIEMPRADGFEVASFIRNDERLAKVPIIMITSRSGDKHRERARSFGVDHYLIKPYQEDQLLQQVQSLQVMKRG